MLPYEELGKFADEFGKHCPACGMYASQRRGGCCPHCGAHIEIYAFGKAPNRHTMYVYRKGNCKEIVEEVQSKIRISKGQANFTFTSLNEQLGMARVLLNKCGGEADIAYAVINAFFDPDIRRRLGIWINIYHVGSIIAKGGCFDPALAWARTRARCERAEPVSQETYFEMVPAYAN